MDTVRMKAGPHEVALLNGCRVAARGLKGQAFEPESLEAWTALCVPGEIVVDVGAYTGIYAIAAAKSGARAIAFEALPANAGRLQLNAGINGVAIDIRRMALSDRHGMVPFHFNERVALTSGGSLIDQGGSRIMVLARRLSDLSLPGRVAALKIDVERAETKVIAGALELIERDRPQIIAEALDPQAVRALGEALPGYRLNGILDGRNAHLVPI